MPRIVLVHGSLVGGRATWREQRRGIGEAAELVVLERPGFDTDLVSDFSRTPALASSVRVDFEDHAVWVAELLEPDDHLVGHSYGGVVTLLAAARASDLGSLTVIEPPATRIALDVPEVAAFARGGADLWANGPRDDPDAFMRAFLTSVGSDFDPPVPLPPKLLQGARVLVGERGPWEADIPLEALAAQHVPTLVVSGGHHPAFEAICDRLEQALHAERVVLPGLGHNAQLHPEFNRVLLDFVVRNESTRND